MAEVAKQLGSYRTLGTEQLLTEQLLNQYIFAISIGSKFSSSAKINPQIFKYHAPNQGGHTQSLERLRLSLSLRMMTFQLDTVF